jgi:hypothetical protein
MGPYLNKDLSATQLNGQDWQSYDQRVIATDLQYGFGHSDVRAEFAIADFEVPYGRRIDGPAGYIELRTTLTPRFFVAARGEFNRYPFIRPVSATTWISRRNEFVAYEAGIGFRFGANTLLKVSASGDRWVVTPENAPFVQPGGSAAAVQLSRAFDVGEWFRRAWTP